VAEHSLRAAQIGYILAKMENYANPFEVCTMVVFHDMGECRLGDLHKLAARYTEAKEEQAVIDQTADLGEMGAELLSNWQQVDFKSTTAGIIGKDADYLEQAFVAKEYLEKGMVNAQEWIDNVSKALKTASAKALLEQMLQMDSTAWWKGLKKLS